MTAVSQTLAAQLRALRSKGLDFDQYSRELIDTAGISGRDAEDSVIVAERVMALRHRLRLLEARVRELKAKDEASEVSP